MQTGKGKLWYQKFHDDKNNWHMESMDQAPFVIAHEYKRLFDMIGNGEGIWSIFSNKRHL